MAATGDGKGAAAETFEADAARAVEAFGGVDWRAVLSSDEPPALAILPRDDVGAAERERREAEALAARVARQLERCVVPDLRHATLDNFRAETVSQRVALQAVRAWVVAAVEGRKALLALVGPTGVGKSHLLYAATAEVIRSGRRRVAAYPWYSLADELRDAKTGDDAARRVKREAEDAEVLALDEVCHTSGTGFDELAIKPIACRFSDYRRAAIVTSNVHPIEAVIGAAALSRFHVVTVVGADARKA